ncbi:MAG: heparinase II/III-family protein [Spirochaetaceae bacterium]
MLQNWLNSVDARLKETIDLESYLPGTKSKNRWRSLDINKIEEIKKTGLTALQEPWSNIPTTLYMDFHRTGNRKRFQKLYFDRRIKLIHMVLAHCVGEDSPEMLDGIINALGSICEESTWVVPAHNWPQTENLPPLDHNIVDLFAANTSSLLVMTVHLLKDPLMKEVPRLVERVTLECYKRCIQPYMENSSQWWMGFVETPGFGPVNNWNPWITSNFLHTLFLLNKSKYSPQQGVVRAVSILNNYLETLSADGGCNEGPAYWNHSIGSLYDCLDILNFACDSTEEPFQDKWFKKAASYLERMFISENYFINFADSSGKLDSLPYGLIARIGKAVNNQSLIKFALESQKNNPVDLDNKDVFEEAFSSFRLIRNLFASVSLDENVNTGKLETDLFEDLQIAIFNDTKSGLMLACKGGHNNECHNHNDVGQFVIYADGEPMVIDPGVGDYTKDTFNHKRYAIWTMQSGWHNLPTINGTCQEVGQSFECDNFHKSGDSVSMSISNAYPIKSGVNLWNRQLFLNRENSSIRLIDSYGFEKDNNNICWNFMFVARPKLSNDKPGLLTIESSKGQFDMTWDYKNYNLEVEPKEIPEDDHKMGSWGVKTLWRIKIKNINPILRSGTTEFQMVYRR